MGEKSEKNIDKTPDETFEEAVLNDVVDKLPEEDRHQVKKMIGMSMQMSRVMSSSPEMELMKKMTSENIASYLEVQKEGMKYQFKEERESKIFLVFVLLFILAFIIILVVMLKDSPDILEKVLYSLGGLIVGLFGGYGYGKSKKDD